MTDTDHHHQSWGRYPLASRQNVVPLRWTSDVPAFKKIPGTVLPYGWGRSYGDSCLNPGGTLLDCGALDRFISFHPHTGLLRCEAGVRLDQVLALALPAGWFLPVSPGTKFVSVAGAIANDIHGKNHHRAGTFGRHVTALELLRSDGKSLVCGPTQNSALFKATVGGLGLTGLILWAEIQLKKVAGPDIAQETHKYRDLDEFFKIAADSEKDWEYTVAWVDCLARGRSLGRGHFIRGDHAPAHGPRKVKRSVKAPFAMPGFMLEGPAMKVLNAAYYHRQFVRVKSTRVDYDPFFYPLDNILEWNRFYGKSGFLQWQCAVPFGKGEEAVRRILEATSGAGMGELKAVLKTFGKLPSPGMMSFPLPGITLALDFANRGEATLGLLDRLDRLVLESGGRVYPAKDARMAPDSFKKFFPQWKKFSAYIDPRFSSGFWRRVTGVKQ